MDGAANRIAPDVVLGKDVRIVGFANLYGCVLGDGVQVGPFVEIQRGVRVGSRVKIQSHAFLCSGVTVEDEAFIGHGVMFTNDLFPRATNADGSVQTAADWKEVPTWVGRRASIGSNATILCGVSIGEEAMVGAGSVVTRDVPPRAVVAGNPARILRYLRTDTAMDTITVPFLDLPAQHAALKKQLLDVAGRALDAAAFIGGAEVSSLEREFAAFCGAQHCVGVGSGTEALALALRALGVGPGDVVVTVPNTFIATAEAVSLTGARFAFIDVDPATCLMAPERLEAYCTKFPVPKVVVPVHLYGQCADMTAINELARRFGFDVLEDAAQAHGASHHGRKAGTLGRIAAFSFYPGKNLGACGEAGAVTTDDADLAETVRRLRDHGQSRKYHHALEGTNSRLDALQAGFLRVKLPFLEDWNQRRRAVADAYDKAFGDLPGVRPVAIAPGNIPSRHLYVLHVPDREALQRFLSGVGIATGLHYPVPLHLQECYRRLGHAPGDFPASEASARSLLSLPLFPEMTARQVKTVIDAVRGFFGAGQ